jgi:hypothetical protein
MRGVIPPSTVREAIRRIKAFNAERGHDLQISLTFTVGRWNYARDRIKSYFDYCESLGVDKLRLNNFCDHDFKHPELRLSRAEMEGFYVMVKELNEQHQGKLKLSVSEDFGLWGVEVMGFPERVGDCAAGENLFGVVYPDVYACPQLCTMRVGQVTPEGAIAWDDAAMARMAEAKRHRDYSGCIAVSWVGSPAIQEIVGLGPQPLRRLSC